jgi:hypothetical protein
MKKQTLHKNNKYKLKTTNSKKHKKQSAGNFQQIPLFKSNGNVNTSNVKDTQQKLVSSIEKEINKYDKQKINEGIQHETLIPTLEDSETDPVKIKEAQELKAKAQKRLDELKHLATKSAEVDRIAITKQYTEQDKKEMDELAEQNEKTMLNFMQNPVNIIGKTMKKLQITIVYIQVLTIFVRCLICANLVYSQDPKQIIITIWEILAESPHLWVYISDYGIDTLGKIGKQIIQFPIIKHFFNLIMFLVKAPDNQTAQQFIEEKTKTISQYLNYFLSKASSAYGVYRYLTATNGPASHLHETFSELGKKGVLNLFKETGKLGTGVAMAGINYYKLCANPENLVSLTSKMIDGNSDAHTIVKALAKSGAWVMGRFCQIVCMNTPLINNSAEHCKMCDIMLKIPFLSSVIYSVSLDILEGVSVLHKYYGNDKSKPIKQSTLISTLCVRRLPYEQTEQFTQRKADRSTNVLVNAIEKGWLIEDNNGNVRAMTAKEVEYDGVPSSAEANELRKKFLNQNDNQSKRVQNMVDDMEDKANIFDEDVHASRFDKTGNKIIGNKNWKKTKKVTKSAINNTREAITNSIDSTHETIKKTVKNMSNKPINSKLGQELQDKLEDLEVKDLEVKEKTNEKINLKDNTGTISNTISNKYEQLYNTIENKIDDKISKSEQNIEKYNSMKNLPKKETLLLNNLAQRLKETTTNDLLQIKKIKEKNIDNVSNKIEEELTKNKEHALRETLSEQNKTNDEIQHEIDTMKDKIEDDIDNTKIYLTDESNRNKSLLGYKYVVKDGEKKYIDEEILSLVQKRQDELNVEIPTQLRNFKINAFWNNTEIEHDKLNKDEITKNAIKQINKKFLKNADDVNAMNMYLKKEQISRNINKDKKKEEQQKLEKEAQAQKNMFSFGGKKHNRMRGIKSRKTNKRTKKLNKY